MIRLLGQTEDSYLHRAQYHALPHMYNVVADSLVLARKAGLVPGDHPETQTTSDVTGIKMLKLLILQAAFHDTGNGRIPIPGNDESRAVKVMLEKINIHKSEWPARKPGDYPLQRNEFLESVTPKQVLLAASAIAGTLARDRHKLPGPGVRDLPGDIAGQNPEQALLRHLLLEPSNSSEKNLEIELSRVCKKIHSETGLCVDHRTIAALSETHGEMINHLLIKPDLGSSTIPQIVDYLRDNQIDLSRYPALNSSQKLEATNSSELPTALVSETPLSELPNEVINTLFAPGAIRKADDTSHFKVISDLLESYSQPREAGGLQITEKDVKEFATYLGLDEGAFGFQNLPELLAIGTTTQSARILHGADLLSSLTPAYVFMNNITNREEDRLKPQFQGMEDPRRYWDGFIGFLTAAFEGYNTDSAAYRIPDNIQAASSGQVLYGHQNNVKNADGIDAVVDFGATQLELTKAMFDMMMEKHGPLLTALHRIVANGVDQNGDKQDRFSISGSSISEIADRLLKDDVDLNSYPLLAQWSHFGDDLAEQLKSDYTLPDYMNLRDSCFAEIPPEILMDIFMPGTKEEFQKKYGNEGFRSQRTV
jgi:hypothetical protein